MAKEFIFLLLLTTLLNLVPAQIIEDDPPPVAPLNVTEIRRVMPDGSGTKDARNYATQVMVEDFPSLIGNYSFILEFTGADGVQHSIQKDVTLEFVSPLKIIFDVTIPEEAVKQLLLIMNGTQVLGLWSGHFNISDTKARVAVIADNYLRVTTGTFDEVSPQDKTELTCSSTNSPCYYSKDIFGDSFPPDVQRCVGLEYVDKNEKTQYLQYCDDTFSNLSSLADEPTRILLDDKNLNLRYPPTNNTYEVLVVENGNPSIEETVFFCYNSERTNNGCEVNITIPGQKKKVDFIIATVDQSDFVEGSHTYPFDIFTVDVKQMTDDSVIASWISDSEEEFNVFITTKSDLDGFEYNLNRTCPGTEERCESLFINVTKEDNHIAVVQNGKNAIGKTIMEESTGQSNITRISKTYGDKYNLTFMVQNKINRQLPSVKLIEVNIAGDRLVKNKFYSGSVSTISQGYLFNSNEVSGTFDSERKFYLVEYDNGTFSNIPDRCGVAYVTFVDYEFELNWVKNGSSVIRGLAYGQQNVTVGNETCYHNSPCYVDVNERDEDVNICTVINNSAPSGDTIEQCEDQMPSIPSELEEDPILILIDNSNLNLRYNTSATFEVLALNMEGHMISKDQNFTCVKNDGGCLLNVPLANDSPMVDFTIVSVSENKSLLKSKVYPFENVPLDTWYLTEDAVIANWTQAKTETFSASIRIKSNLDDDKYSLSHRCASSSCEYFFIIADTREESEYLAVLSNGTNAVAKTIMNEPPEESRIKKISKRVISDSTSSTTLTVSGAASTPSRAKLVEVSGSAEAVENILYDGDVIKGDSSVYEFVTSDNISFVGERKFLLVEYSEEKVTRAGPAYVTFVDYDFELYWVRNGSYVMRGLSYGQNDVIVGSETCYHSNPCYIEGKGKQVNICTIIQNLAQSGILHQCIDQTPSTPSELEEDPMLLLIDNTNLNLRYDTDATFEVLALDVDGHISKGQGFVCKKNDGGCSLNVPLTNDSAIVDFTIVSVSKNISFMNSSKARPFEILELETRYLTGDAVLTSWTSKSGKEFSAAIYRYSDLDSYIYKSDTECSGEGMDGCVYYFTKVNQSENYFAVVQNGSNAVGKTLQKDSMSSQLEIFTISRTVEEGNNITTFTFGTNSTPLSVNLIEVTEYEDGLLSNLETRGEVSSMEEHYRFKCSSDIGSLESERNFLLIEYDANNKVKRAGAVYVENKFAVDLMWISNTTILRERVLDDKYVLIGNEGCNIHLSPCYPSAFSTDVKYVPLCTQVENLAKVPKDTVVVCEDQKPDITEGLTVDKLQLQEDAKDDSGNITLSAACIEDSDHVGLALFSTGKPLNITEIECIQESTNSSTCESSFVPLTNSSQPLNLMVVCTSGGNVTASGHIDVEHLKFNVSKLDNTSMVVYWTAANAKNYVATLVEDPGMFRSDGEWSSEIHCDSENSCYSTFFYLDPKKNYQLSVHKKGDNSSSTGTNINLLDHQDQKHDYNNITKVSRVNDSRTKVSLLHEAYDGVKILVKVTDGGVPSDVSGEGTAVDYTKRIFEISHDVPIFDKENAIFTVLESLSYRRTVNLTLQDLDAKVAWVGAKKDTKGASLRVDVGSQDKIQLGSLLCEKESSPCYFLEVELGYLPEVLERCVKLSGNILQCNEEVTPFTAMDVKDVNIALEDNVLEVVASLSEPGARIELKVYDPSNPKTVFSEGNVTCENVIGDEDLLMCAQAVQLPNGQSDLKVIVTEISSKGIALKSVIMDFTVPMFGVESWVIVVCVLGALIFAATGSYFTVVYVRKKKSREWESNTIAKEVEVIDSIYSEITVSRGNQIPNMPSGESSPRTPESSITLPERQIISQRPHIPDRRQDDFSERPFSRGRAPIPVARRGGFPDGQFSHSQSPNELLDRRPPTYPKPLGYRNKAFVSSESDDVGDLQPIKQPMVKLSSKLNMSSLQSRIAEYQQSRV